MPWVWTVPSHTPTSGKSRRDWCRRASWGGCISQTLRTCSMWWDKPGTWATGHLWSSCGELRPGPLLFWVLLRAGQKHNVKPLWIVEQKTGCCRHVCLVISPVGEGEESLVKKARGSDSSEAAQYVCGTLLVPRVSTWEVAPCSGSWNVYRMRSEQQINLHRSLRSIQLVCSKNYLVSIITTRTTRAVFAHNTGTDDLCTRVRISATVVIVFFTSVWMFDHRRPFWTKTAIALCTQLSWKDKSPNSSRDGTSPSFSSGKWFR